MTKPKYSELMSAQKRVNITYSFPELEKSGQSAAITILESRSLIASGGTTGLRSWEAAILLAHFLASDGRKYIQKQRIIELGAGTGLVSMLCAKYLGAEYVLSTDGSQEVISALEDLNLFCNGLDHGSNFDCRVLRWGQQVETSEDGVERSFDIVIGADIVRPAMVQT